MQAFMRIKELLVGYIVLILLLKCTSVLSGGDCTESMSNVFRYSKNLSKNMAPAVSAVLMECPKNALTPSCQRKIMVNIHVSPESQTCKKQKYLILDEIFDQSKQSRAKLMSPYLIELTRGEPVLMYPLEFVKNMECDTCEGKVRRTQGSMKSAANSVKTKKQNIVEPADETVPALGNIANNHQFNTKNQQHLKGRHSKSSLQNEYDGGDAPINIDIALNDDGNAVEATNGRSNRRSQHDGFKRNSEHLQKLLSNNEDFRKDYDELFEELEQKNEKIKKDILEILKPALHITDEDLVLANIKSRQDDSTDGCPEPPVICPCKCSSTTTCPPCLPCPNCPSLPPIPISPKCGKLDVKLKESNSIKENGNEDQILYERMPSRMANELSSIRNPSPRAMYKARRYHRRIGLENQNGMRLQQNDELPIQEVSEDSSDPENLNIASSEDGDTEPIEESEDLFGSIDENDDNFFRPGYENLERPLKATQTGSKYGRTFIRNSIQGDASNEESPDETPEVRTPLEEFNQDWELRSQFAQNNLDPIQYDGHSIGKVDRYPSLLSSNEEPIQYSSPMKTNHKKDTQFVSYSNGYGLNVDMIRLPDNLTDHALKVTPMSHQYIDYADGDKTSNLQFDQNKNPQSMAFPKRQTKKSVPRLTPHGIVYQAHRPISITKLKNPIQQFQMSPGVAQLRSSSSSRSAPIKGNVHNLKGSSRIHGEVELPPFKGSAANLNSPLQMFPSANAEADSFQSQSGLSVIPVQSLKNHDKLTRVYPQNFDPRELGNQIDPVPMEAENPIETDSDLDVIEYPSNEVISQGNKDNKYELPLSKYVRRNSPVKKNFKKFAEKPALKSTAGQIDEDGGDYDYYDQDTSELSDFPFVLAKRPRLKYPTVYKRPVATPDIPTELESDDRQAPAFLENDDDYKISHKRSQHPTKRRGRRPQHRGHPDRSATEWGDEARKLLSQVDEDLLPAKVPFEEVIDDPNLNTRDKINLIEIIDPHNINVDTALKNFEHEIQNSLYYIPKQERDQNPQPFDGETMMKTDRDGKDIRKRSFAFYDDLEPLETDTDYDGLTAARHLPAFDSFKDTDSRFHGGGNSNSRSKFSNSKRPIFKESKNGVKWKKSTGSVDDIWYSVFNMSAPLQFLTTRVRIFRKRENSWWRIAPSITLTSLSGIYANANLSILFSSHVELYNLEKPLLLKNHRLLVPNKTTTSISPKEVLAVDSEKFRVNDMETEESVDKNICELVASKLTLAESGDTASDVHKRNDDTGVHSVEDFGDFPLSLNILEQCKNDPNHLCLNMLDEESPGFKVKVQIPFRDNTLIYKDYFKVRITSIIVDGTVSGAVQLTVTFVNEALISQEFDIVIADCRVTTGAKNIVQKVAPPHRGIIIAFFLPLEDMISDTKYHCEVQIRTVSHHIIARRQAIVQPKGRCLCIWKCNCHCIKDSVSTLVSDMCEELPTWQDSDAGFESKNDSRTAWIALLFWVLLFLLLLLLLGCIKAWIGICIVPVGRWKYNYLQPMMKYDDASRPRRFLINCIFFLCFPFVWLCRCFQPNEEDLLQSANWECSVIQQRIDSSVYSSSSNDDDDNEDTESKENLAFMSQLQKDGKAPRAEAGEAGTYAQSINRYLFEEFHGNCEQEKRDTEYVRKVLDESRQSLKQVDGGSHINEDLLPSDPRNSVAAAYVQRLLDAKIVYRTFRTPVASANLPRNQAFSIRGYFVPSIGSGYQFITHTPLRQHWAICPDINGMRPLLPPLVLLSKNFSRNYESKMDVYNVNDLVLCPCVTAPCINVLVQDIDMYDDQLDEDDDCNDCGVTIKEIEIE